jgi:putative intracellular protease/amidase
VKILMVPTSHDVLGNTGLKTGFWLEEFAAPYFVFRDAGVQLTLASPKGGQPLELGLWRQASPSILYAPCSAPTHRLSMQRSGELPLTLFSPQEEHDQTGGLKP